VAKADKREAKLRGFLAKLEAGQHVQNRDLETWLGAEYAGMIQGAWEQQLDLRKEFLEKPDAIVEYENLFRVARLLENRSEGYSTRGKHKQAQIFHAKAQAAYDRLLERYQEITAADYTLHGWFDRIADFSLGNSPNLSAIDMPKVRTSRSLDNMSRGSSIAESKRDVKIGVVRAALRDIADAQNPVTTSENASNRLDRFLKNLDADTD
jgi:tetratricopeptide (TPR) repeat protein